MANLSSASLRGAVDLTTLVNRANRPAVDAGAHGAAGPASPTEPIAVPSLVLDATEQNFQTLLELSALVPIVLLFGSTRSAQTGQLAPVLERAVRGAAGRLLMARVDVDANAQLAAAFQVQAVPTVAALVAGSPVAMFSGAVADEQLLAVLQQLLTLAGENGVTGTVSAPDEPANTAEAPEPIEAPLPPLHQAAFDAIGQGDYASAIRSYRTAIAQDPRDALAIAGLAQVSLLARLQSADAEQVRSAAAANPAGVVEALAVADLDLSGGHVEDAFARLLELFARLDSDGRNQVRTRLLDYFEIVGAEDPRVSAARRQLTMLLY